MGRVGRVLFEMRVSWGAGGGGAEGGRKGETDGQTETKGGG